jgi:hyperosmotically inducible protein
MKIRIIAFPIATAFMLAISNVSFAQQGGPTATDQMRRAGDSAQAAVSDTGQALKHTAEGTGIAARDSAITAKVKTALYNANVTSRGDVHVSTSGGVVKLTGDVRSARVAAQAQQIARQTAGVKGVDNRLAVKLN